MSIGYYLLLVEDNSEQNSVVSMNLFNLILVLAGLATPLAGFAVERMGLVDAERLFLLVSVVSMSTLTISRHLLIKETETGKKAQARMREKTSVSPITGIFGTYGEVIRYIVKEKRVASAVLANSLIYVYYTVGTSNSLLFTPYFADYLKLSSSHVSWVGGIYAVGTLLAMFVLNPRLSRRNIPMFTAGACVASLIGFSILVFAAPGSLGVILGGVFIIAVSYGVLKTVADSLLAIETDTNHRAGVYACSFFFSSLLGIVAVAICTRLYVRFPGWLFIISGMLVTVVLCDTIRKLRGTHERSSM